MPFSGSSVTPGGSPFAVNVIGRTPDVAMRKITGWPGRTPQMSAPLICGSSFSGGVRMPSCAVRAGSVIGRSSAPSSHVKRASPQPQFAASNAVHTPPPIVSSRISRAPASGTFTATGSWPSLRSPERHTTLPSAHTRNSAVGLP